jgi:hypothetical protein
LPEKLPEEMRKRYLDLVHKYWFTPTEPREKVESSPEARMPQRALNTCSLPDILEAVKHLDILLDAAKEEAGRAMLHLPSKIGTSEAAWADFDSILRLTEDFTDLLRKTCSCSFRGT